jgi:hypothetical protein
VAGRRHWENGPEDGLFHIWRLVHVQNIQEILR